MDPAVATSAAPDITEAPAPLSRVADGKPLSAGQLDYRFGQARECAGIEPADFQFRDLRAKAATETDDARGMEAAQGLLGHASAGMTRRYIRRRAGKLVEPTK